MQARGDQIGSGSAGHFVDRNDTEIFSQHGDQKSPARFFNGWNDDCLRRYLIVIIEFINGGQGQNRTADTGIFRASKINNLLISLKQVFFGTVGDSHVDSAG